MSKQTLHMGAAMNIPQVLGYTRIAGTPVVTGLYTVLLPLVAFAVFGSSRHLVVAAILIVSLGDRIEVLHQSNHWAIENSDPERPWTFKGEPLYVRRALRVEYTYREQNRDKTTI